MSDPLLERLERRHQEAEEKVKESKKEIARLEEEIHLNGGIAKDEDYREDMSKEDREALKYETEALAEIKRWEQSKLEEAKQDLRILAFKVKFRKHRM